MDRWLARSVSTRLDSRLDIDSTTLRPAVQRRVTAPSFRDAFQPNRSPENKTKNRVTIESEEMNQVETIDFSRSIASWIVAGMGAPLVSGSSSVRPPTTTFNTPKMT